jgi:hypothetical protein
MLRADPGVIASGISFRPSDHARDPVAAPERAPRAPYRFHPGSTVRIPRTPCPMHAPARFLAQSPERWQIPGIDRVPGVIA